MTLNQDEFVRLTRISKSLRRSDPELARKLAAPMRRCSIWTVLCYLTLSVLAFVTPAVVAISDTTSPGSSIAKGALHGDETTAADFRPQVRDQTDGHSAGRHTMVMGIPINYSGRPPAFDE
ncbi:DUF3040 domain-containing protein [Pseudonocardia alaniniphila]|uniref:DUF3040 domain-containing protein n=1 Tax=Pseudonocardia alaniniphila TaxID=75291 RepID=A0ABS9TUZ9_9PSEU|nr:DUF3040 domain-containing protein [Pseudonocardia alaniniphila]MCH6172382.1 DUF3040 domain-containing protein [Pseudonocardia alaniniphila]